jgi:hypothetical protein
METLHLCAGLGGDFHGAPGKIETWDDQLTPARTTTLLPACSNSKFFSVPSVPFVPSVVN